MIRRRSGYANRGCRRSMEGCDPSLRPESFCFASSSGGELHRHQAPAHVEKSRSLLTVTQQLLLLLLTLTVRGDDLCMIQKTTQVPSRLFLTTDDSPFFLSSTQATKECCASCHCYGWYWYHTRYHIHNDPPVDPCSIITVPLSMLQSSGLCAHLATVAPCQRMW